MMPVSYTHLAAIHDENPELGIAQMGGVMLQIYCHAHEMCIRDRSARFLRGGMKASISGLRAAWRRLQDCEPEGHI